MNNFDQQELDKFSKLADEWWNPNGKFKTIVEKLVKKPTKLSNRVDADVPFCKYASIKMSKLYIINIV